MIEMSLLEMVSVCGVIKLHRGQNPNLLQANYTNRHKGIDLKPYMKQIGLLERGKLVMLRDLKLIEAVEGKIEKDITFIYTSESSGSVLLKSL